jgi:hypothetical protein
MSGRISPVVFSFNHGFLLPVFDSDGHQLKLDEFWRERLPESREHTSWHHILVVLCAYRLIDPGSEWRLHREWYQKSAMGDLLDADFSLAAKDNLCRCLDRLVEDKEALFTFLQERWKDLFGVTFDVLLYDLTSTYFESNPPFPEGDKRKFGYSRDKRSDCVQVVIALVVTPEGFPLAYEVMSGNTSDKTTLKGFLDKNYMALKRSKPKVDDTQLDLFSYAGNHPNHTDAVRNNGRETLAGVPFEHGAGTGTEGDPSEDAPGGGGKDEGRDARIDDGPDPARINGAAGARPGLGDGEGTLYPPAARNGSAVGYRPRVNYRITPADRIGEGSLKQKAQNNLAAIRLMRGSGTENRPPHRKNSLCS